MYMTKVFVLNYMKFETSNWKLRVFSCGWWSKHFGVSILFRHLITVALKIGLVEFPGPVATLLLNQKRKRGSLKK
jgi:hypothetical protein